VILTEDVPAELLHWTRRNIQMPHWLLVGIETLSRGGGWAVSYLPSLLVMGIYNRDRLPWGMREGGNVTVLDATQNL